MIFRIIKILSVLIVVFAFALINQVDIFSQIMTTTPFERELPPLEKPENTSVDSIRAEVEKESKPVLDNLYVNPETQVKSYIYKPNIAFTLVVTSDVYPDIKPDKSVYGVISLKISPDYKAAGRVIYAKKKYRFDRLSWAIETGWNETIPFFSRLSSFKKYLKPFNQPVYAHFYIMGVKEYPEYPTQYYHWPREALEDYYLYILRKIDSVATQN
ncbi:MAG: hypothetical protein AB7V50_00965 [Vampirovibrionia bacterium]